jgi:hypothetical protein
MTTNAEEAAEAAREADELLMTPESNEMFWKIFNRHCGEITSECVNDDLEFQYDALRGRIAKLQAFVNEAAGTLPTYDIKRCQEEIMKLLRELLDKASSVRPRKKFTFAARKRAKERSAASSSTPADSQFENIDEQIANNYVETADNDIRGSRSIAKQLLSTPGNHVIDHQKSAVLSLHKEELKSIGDNPVQLLIESCTDTVVAIDAVIGSVRLQKLSKCVIILGPVCTAAYFEECKDCRFVVASHQMRIHQCHNSAFHVRVKSHPIIEDCSALGFTPYNISYPSIADHLGIAGLAEASSWSNVVDFRWHRSTHSPNWYIIGTSSEDTGSAPAHADMNSEKFELPKAVIAGGWELLCKSDDRMSWTQVAIMRTGEMAGQQGCGETMQGSGCGTICIDDDMKSSGEPGPAKAECATHSAEAAADEGCEEEEEEKEEEEEEEEEEEDEL